MGKLMDRFRGTRRLEMLVLLALAAMLLVFVMDNRQETTDAEMNSAEQRMAGILAEIEGAGEVSVMISDEPDLEGGVVVVASGADSIAVQLKIRDAVRALTSLPAERIEVYASG